MRSPVRSPSKSPIRRRSALTGKNVNIQLSRSNSLKQIVTNSSGSTSPKRKSPIRHNTYSNSPSPQKGSVKNNSFEFYEETEATRTKILEVLKTQEKKVSLLNDVENIIPKDQTNTRSNTPSPAKQKVARTERKPLAPLNIHEFKAYVESPNDNESQRFQLDTQL